ncbi:MAG: lysophospholipid acyltransferase family protein [Chloroflexota bacterium]
MSSIAVEGMYHHVQWESQRNVLRFLLRTVGFTLLVRLRRVEGLENVPQTGPAILIMNHIAFVDPIVVLHVVPRNIVPLAKKEVYDYPIVGIFPRLYGVIPVQRMGFDRKALRQAKAVLDGGEIVLMAPEGTRNKTLQRGKEGFAYLASRTNATVIPIAIEGTEGFPALPLSRVWRQSGAVVCFGRPFRFRPELRDARREQLRQMTDEALYVVARMLPEDRRGVYEDLTQATEETIQML